jgi:hypothetical protein
MMFKRTFKEEFAKSMCSSRAGDLIRTRVFKNAAIAGTVHRHGNSALSPTRPRRGEPDDTQDTLVLEDGFGGVVSPLGRM